MSFYVVSQHNLQVASILLRILAYILGNIANILANNISETGHLRDLYKWKETYTYEKRPTHVKRDLYIWKETYTHEKRPTHMARDLCIWKETYTFEKRPRDLYIWSFRRIYPRHFTRDPVCIWTGLFCILFLMHIGLAYRCLFIWVALASYIGLFFFFNFISKTARLRSAIYVNRFRWFVSVHMYRSLFRVSFVVVALSRKYGVATISRLLKITGLFRRISSLL